MFVRIARWLRVALIAALLALALWRVTQRREEIAGEDAAPAPLPTPATAARAAAVPEALAPRAQPPLPPAAPPPDVPGAETDLLGGDAIAAAWANVDLAEAQRAMPDNLYWRVGAPTTDAAEIERRAAERAQWNVEYGKVLSGTGSDEEIRAYYDHRARLSGDYVEFVTWLLDHHQAALPERDVALLQLARRLHLARLEEIPRRMDEALQRKREQDEARARWLADEQAFRAGGDAAADGRAENGN